MNASTRTGDWNRWLVVCVFAIAMAWVESAVVYDLRTMVNRLEPYQADPLPLVGKLGPVELVRELATMVMLFTVGVLAAKKWPQRLAYSAIAFGVWDIFYYVFLKVMYGWPHSLLDWDILFLLPLPWWGPVLAPVLIALLMIVWGTRVTQFECAPTSTNRTLLAWALNFTGMFLALYVFMTDTLRAANQGVLVVRKVLPTEFNWPLLLVALVLMAAPIVAPLWKRRRTRSPEMEGVSLAVD